MESIFILSHNSKCMFAYNSNVIRLCAIVLVSQFSVQALRVRSAREWVDRQAPPFTENYILHNNHTHINICGNHRMCVCVSVCVCGKS